MERGGGGGGGGGGAQRRRGDRGVWGRKDEDTVVPGFLLLSALCTRYTAHHLCDYNTGTVGLMLAYLVSLKFTRKHCSVQCINGTSRQR